MRWAGRSGAPLSSVVLVTFHKLLAKSWMGYFGDGQSANDELDPDSQAKLETIFPFPDSGMRFDLPPDQAREWLRWS